MYIWDIDIELYGWGSYVECKILFLRLKIDAVEIKFNLELDIIVSK